MTTTDTTLLHIPIEQLFGHADNLRQDLGDLGDLTASIDALGIIEPLVVMPAGLSYVILAGHRRLAAAQQASLDTVPCVVRDDVDDQQATEIMLVENLQRTGLNPIEEGEGYRRLNDLGLSQREIADRVGRNQSHVSKRMTLTVLPERAREWVVAGRLKIDDALEIAKLDDDADRAATIKHLDRFHKDTHYKDKPVETWAVTEAISKVAGDRKRAKSIETGKASKLKRLKSEPSKYYGDFEPCKKAEATHWFVADHGSGRIIWARERPEGQPASTGRSDMEWRMGQYRPRDEVNAGDALLDQRAERRDSVLDELVNGEADRIITLAASCALTALDEDSRLQLTALDLGDVSDPEVALGITIIETLASATADRITWGGRLTPVDYAAYDALVDLGYELDEGERAALPVLDAAGVQADAAGEEQAVDGEWTIKMREEPLVVDEQFTVVDLAPDLDESPEDVYEPGGYDEDHAAELAEEIKAAHVEPVTIVGPGTTVTITPDPAPEPDGDTLTDWAGEELAAMQATVPWKGYQFVKDEARLADAIREHNGLDKLRHAAVYEAANGNRAIVLAALRERIDVLEAGAA